MPSASTKPCAPPKPATNARATVRTDSAACVATARSSLADACRALRASAALAPNPTARIATTIAAIARRRPAADQLAIPSPAPISRSDSAPG